MSGGGMGSGGLGSMDILGTDFARMQQAASQANPSSNGGYAGPAKTSGFESAFAGMLWLLLRWHSSQ